MSKPTKRVFKVWVPIFRTYKLTDAIVAGDGHMPVYSTKKVGLKHWHELVRATLTLDPPKQKKAPARKKRK